MVNLKTPKGHFEIKWLLVSQLVPGSREQDIYKYFIEILWCNFIKDFTQLCSKLESHLITHLIFSWHQNLNQKGNAMEAVVRLRISHQEIISESNFKNSYDDLRRFYVKLIQKYVGDIDRLPNSNEWKLVWSFYKIKRLTWLRFWVLKQAEKLILAKFDTSRNCQIHHSK